MPFKNPIEGLRPNYRNWLRVDGVNRQEDFSETFSLKTADPLWMLARQWQMGEFQAENNARPLYASIIYKSAKVNNLSTSSLDEAGNPTTTKRSLDENSCLEALIEHIQLPLNWRDRIRIGQQIMRYLGNRYLNDFVGLYPFSDDIWLSLPEADTIEAKKLDPQTKDYIELILANGQVLDGKKIVDWLRVALALNENENEKIQEAVETLTSNTKIQEVVKKFHNWFVSLYGSWTAQDSPAWSSKDLNYNFDLEVVKDGLLGISLKASNHPGGTLDWYSFEEAIIHDENTWGEEKTTPPQICTNLEPAGLPKKRLYEFENGSFNLNKDILSKSNLLQVFLVEFGMVYNADWFNLALSLEPGSLAKIHEIKLMDSFGLESTIKQEANTWKNNPLDSFGAFEISREISGMENQHSKTNFLFVPSIVGEVQESLPKEEIIFKRDELNNRIIAEMKTVQNGLGIPQSAENLYSIVLNSTSNNSESPHPELMINAEQYELMKPLPNNQLAYLPKIVEVDISNKVSVVKLVRALQLDQNEFNDQLLLASSLDKLKEISAGPFNVRNSTLSIRKKSLRNVFGKNFTGTTFQS
ncbi:MAG: hypothetical protein AAF927_03820 [Bacteroidota bacterium]